MKRNFVPDRHLNHPSMINVFPLRTYASPVINSERQNRN